MPTLSCQCCVMMPIALGAAGALLGPAAVFVLIALVAGAGAGLSTRLERVYAA